MAKKKAKRSEPTPPQPEVRAFSLTTLLERYAWAAFALLLVVASVLGITTFLLNMIRLIRARRGHEEALRAPDRIHAAEPATPRR